MSNIYSTLLFLLCLISLHACNGRPLANKEPENQFKRYTKNNEEDGLANMSASEPYFPNKNEVADKYKEVKVDEENIHNQTNSNVVKKEMKKIYVTWHLPHKKRGEQQPGFNLDYSPPKTHPPVHN